MVLFFRYVFILNFKKMGELFLVVFRVLNLNICFWDIGIVA
ncbi:hypothetical protein Xinn_01816 [Xenorhabdus innexi]|uniref:Uncharacterized protein n=1 Tax=Xenorhabdus innexi TaxID=290109 RepID=A0A2G0NMZ0_9GAMM|nr:hypothetical protein Xinn_01816 [Xenorhabdus innexi]